MKTPHEKSMLACKESIAYLWECHGSAKLRFRKAEGPGVFKTEHSLTPQNVL